MLARSSLTAPRILMVEPIMVQVDPAHTVGQLQHYLALILEAPDDANFYITDSRPEALSGKLQHKTMQEAFSVQHRFFHCKLKGVLEFSPTPATAPFRGMLTRPGPTSPADQ